MPAHQSHLCYTNSPHAFTRPTSRGLSGNNAMPPSVHTTSNVAVDPALPRAAPIAGTSVAGRLPAPGADARYTRTAMVLHWLIAALVIVQFGWGWWMQEIPKVPVGPRVDAFNLHKSVGLTILALMVIRLAWRRGHRPPPLPPLPSWQRTAARATHVALYALLVIHPLSGYLGSEFSGYPVRYFGITLPSWGGKNVALKDFLSAMHLATSWAIAALVALHVCGALKHALVHRDGLLARMGVGRSRTARSEPAR